MTVPRVLCRDREVEDIGGSRASVSAMSDRQERTARGDTSSKVWCTRVGVSGDGLCWDEAGLRGETDDSQRDRLDWWRSRDQGSRKYERVVFLVTYHWTRVVR